MPRATQRQIEASKAVDGLLTPSQIARAESEGINVAHDAAATRALEPFIGTGRDYDIAAIRLGVEGYCTRRLRQVLAEPDESRLSMTGTAVESLLAQAARAAVGEGWPDYRAAELPESPAEQAEIALGTMYLDAEDLLLGAHEVGLQDTADIAEEFAVQQLGASGKHLPRDLLGQMMPAVAASLNDASSWARTASDDEIVTALRTIGVICEALEVDRLPIGSEDRWRLIALCAPAAGIIVRFIEAMVTTMADSRARSPRRHPDELLLRPAPAVAPGGAHEARPGRPRLRARP
ncbi:MAG: hypothetical protein M0Z69_00415 [Actinomycetota bacterium]|nr:hypothetical protein [Actinomycetota bacterium]